VGGRLVIRGHVLLEMRKDNDAFVEGTRSGVCVQLESGDEALDEPSWVYANDTILGHTR
jgi:hypothetical protein